MGSWFGERCFSVWWQLLFSRKPKYNVPKILLMVGLCWPALSVVNHCLLSTLHMNTPYCIVPESLLAHTVAGLSITATQTLSSVAASRFPYFNSWVLFTFSNKEKKKRRHIYLISFYLFIFLFSSSQYLQLYEILICLILINIWWIYWRQMKLTINCCLPPLTTDSKYIRKPVKCETLDCKWVSYMLGLGWKRYLEMLIAFVFFPSFP